MKRVFGTFCLILFANIVAPAQQAVRENVPGNNIDKSQKQQAIEPFILSGSAKSPPGLEHPQIIALDRPSFNNSQLSRPENPFQLINGAVYINIFGSISAIPMSGGGASGCFNADLPERIAKLNQLIELFPPTLR